MPDFFHADDRYLSAIRPVSALYQLTGSLGNLQQILEREQVQRLIRTLPGPVSRRLMATHGKGGAVADKDGDDGACNAADGGGDEGAHDAAAN